MSISSAIGPLFLTTASGLGLILGIITIRTYDQDYYTPRSLLVSASRATAPLPQKRLNIAANRRRCAAINLGLPAATRRNIRD